MRHLFSHIFGFGMIQQLDDLVKLCRFCKPLESLPRVRIAVSLVATTGSCGPGFQGTLKILDLRKPQIRTVDISKVSKFGSSELETFSDTASLVSATGSCAQLPALQLAWLARRAAALRMP